LLDVLGEECSNRRLALQGLLLSIATLCATSETHRRAVLDAQLLPLIYFADAAEFLEGSRCRIRVLLLDVLGEECSKDIETPLSTAIPSVIRRS
jgi:hypothetical protein